MKYEHISREIILIIFILHFKSKLHYQFELSYLICLQTLIHNYIYNKAESTRGRWAVVQGDKLTYSLIAIYVHEGTVWYLPGNRYNTAKQNKTIIINNFHRKRDFTPSYYNSYSNFI